MGAAKKQADTAKQKQVAKLAEYFRGVVSELKKVHWPDRKQLLTYTGVVFVAVAIMSVALWIVDSGLGIVLSRILG